MFLFERRSVVPTYPITTEEVKASARIDGSEFDSQILRNIASAAFLAEHESGRSLVTQTWKASYDDWPRGLLARSPVQSIEAVEYWDGATWASLPAAAFTLAEQDNDRAELVWLGSLPLLGNIPGARVRVTYVTGYEELPAVAAAWIIAQCVFWLDSPAAATDKPMTPAPFLDGLLDPMRSW